MAEEIKRNPYTGMDMATSDNGNGEVVKVEDLINKPQKDWEQYTPVDTLENADSELSNLNDALSYTPSSNGDTIKLEDLMNSESSNSNELVDSLELKNDELISSLTDILNI